MLHRVEVCRKLVLENTHGKYTLDQKKLCDLFSENADEKVIPANLYFDLYLSHVHLDEQTVNFFSRPKNVFPVPLSKLTPSLT